MIKILFPAVGIGVLGFVFVGAGKVNQKEMAYAVPAVNHVLDLNYEGQSSKGHFFTIHSGQCTEQSKNHLAFDEIHGMLQTNDKDKLMVKAPKGVFHTASKVMVLSGLISLSSTQGLSLSTCDAIFDFDQGTVRGDKKIVGRHHRNKMTAQRFYIHHHGDEIELKGDPTLVIEDVHFLNGFESKMP